MTSFKNLHNDELYEYLYQSNVDEVNIPKLRKARIAMCKKVVNNFRIGGTND